MKLTLDDINRAIVSADYHVFPETTVTVCCLKLRNGFCVIGYSACLDPNDFDPAVGRSMANKNAVEKIWQLEGYLATHLRSTGQAPVIAVVEQAPQPIFMVPEAPPPQIVETMPAADIAPMVIETIEGLDMSDRNGTLPLEEKQEIKASDVGELPSSFLTGMQKIDKPSADDVPPNAGAPA